MKFIIFNDQNSSIIYCHKIEIIHSRAVKLKLKALLDLESSLECLKVIILTEVQDK